MTLGRNKIPLYVQVAACVALSGAPLLAADNPVTALKVKQGPPSGFEQLSAPQETVVDVFYGGLKIGSFRGIYTAKTLSFSYPEEVVAKIPALKHDAIVRVQKALTGDLATEAALICNPRNPQKGCGILKPEVAGVIFYEDRFRADLFVNSALLDTQDTHTDKILPPAPNVFSGVHQFNGSVTGASNATQVYSLLGNSTIAYGPERLNIVGVLSNQQNQLNSFTAGLDKWGLDNEAGFFESRQLQLLPQIAMSGVSVGTSLKTNLALRDAAGSTLEIFLPQRSYVSLVYNNVIYSTDLYEAGNQVLNTTALPQGAYEVTIRIRDLSGAQTEEKRFFAKNFAIPPKDQPIYFGQVGTVRNTTDSGALTGFGTSPIANGGMVRRISENSAIDTDFLVINNKFFTEAGAFLLLPPNHQFQASTLLSSAGDVGFGTTYIGYMFNQKLSISNNMRVIFSKSHPSTNPDDLADPIQGSSRQITSSLAYQVTPKANIGLQANYTETEGSALQYAYGPELRYDFWRNGPNSLQLTANSSNTQLGMQQTVFLNLILRFGAWGYSGQGELARNTGTAAGIPGTSESADARVTWNDDTDPARLTVIGAETRHDSTSNSYITDLNHKGVDGNLQLSASQTDSVQGGDNTFYSGNFGFSVVNTAHQVAWGGNQQDTSGLIFENTGDSTDVPMRAVVDNSERTTFNTGQSTPLFLAPYETYNVSIKPVQSASIDYDGSVRNITLYPGNIVPLTWDINHVYVVVGHVVLPDGTPLTDARMEEARNITVTDSDGLFQGELLALKTVTFKRAAEQPAFLVNADADSFAVPPPAHSFRNQSSSMSVEAQRKAILELFGVQDEEPPAASFPAMPKQAPSPAPKPLPPMPAHKLRPALRCRVTLPEVKAANDVYIYPDALVCTPIPFEEEKGGAPVYGPSLPAPDSAKPPAKSGGVIPVNAVAQSASEREDNQVTALFAAAADRVPRPMPQLLIPNFVATRMAAAVGQGGPFIPSAPPSPKAVAAAPDTSVPARVAPPSSGTTEVQVGSYRSESSAKAAYNVMVKKYNEMAGKPYAIVKADLGVKGIYYRLRLGGFADMHDAGIFCKALAAKGQDCLLVPRKGKK